MKTRSFAIHLLLTDPLPNNPIKDLTYGQLLWAGCTA